MSSPSLEDIRASGAVERLLEESWSARESGAERRELAVEALAGLLFLACAVPLAYYAVLQHYFDPLLAGVLVVLYAITSRLVKFAIGAGYVVPSYLVLVPMLLLLPPGMVPLLACAGLVLGTVAQWAVGQVRAERIPLSVPDAWHTLGPACVLVAWGSHPGVPTVLVYLAAFCAGCLIDLASATLREAAIAGVAPRLQLRVLALVWVIDACIAPLGLLVAHAASGAHAQVLLILPLNAAMVIASRDRNSRIKQAQIRLEAVAHERTRLQTAVRRLGEAMAARLDLAELTTIVLRSSIEALDADGGRLSLEGPGVPADAEIGCSPAAMGSLRGAADLASTRGLPVQLERGGYWALALPFSFSGRAGLVDGSIALTRLERAFRPDEQEVLQHLVDRARRAAVDIVAHELLREQAQTDTLTGLGNRRKLAADIQHWRGPRAEPLILMLFDLDGFKGYNDTFGHMAGDAMLARLGAKLAGVVESSGAAYRLGGDEFCATLRADLPDLEVVICEAAAALTERGEDFTVGASWGAVLIPHETASIDYALQLADERMYARKRGRPERSTDHTREILMRIMSAHQPVLADNSSELPALARRVGARMGVGGEQLDELVRAAELQDIGTVGIPDSILSKAGPLTEADWRFVRQQPLLGERILSAAPALRPVASIVRSARERWDGRGYPDGLAGELAPLGSRILGACVAYHAMISERSHRPRRDHGEAISELLLEAGLQFDPAVIDALVAELSSPLAPALQSVLEAIEPDSVTAAEVAARLREMLEDLGVPEAPTSRARPADR